MGRYHWSLCRLHHTNPPQLKATGPSLIASDIQHNLPNSACACHGISQNCLTFDEVLDQILIQCSTFELGDNGVLRMQSHYCGRPVGLCQIPLQITFDLPTGVSKISSCGVNLLTLGAGHVVQWCTLCRSHGKVKPSQLILSASHVDLAPNFSGTLFGISNTVSGGGMGSIAPLICFIIQIKFC